MNLVIDASVFVAAARAPEVHHADSVLFLQQAEKEGANFFCPTLVLAECSAAVARQTSDSSLTERTVASIERLPHLYLVDLDSALAHQAADIAKTQRLRGADAVYAATAQVAGATLLTWDAEMLERGAKVVQTTTPARWLEQNNSAQEKE